MNKKSNNPPNLFHEGDGIRTAVDLFILSQDGKRILLGLRNSPSGKGTWSFIGGHQRTGEKVQDTITRELSEEIKKDAKIIITDEIVAVRENRIPPTYAPHITVILRGEFVSGKALNKSKRENADIRWFELDSLPPNLFSGVKQCIDAYRKKEVKVITDWHLP